MYVICLSHTVLASRLPVHLDTVYCSPHARLSGTPAFLTKLALERVESCPFKGEEVKQLKEEVAEALEGLRLQHSREPEDRSDVPIVFAT